MGGHMNWWSMAFHFGGSQEINITCTAARMGAGTWVMSRRPTWISDAARDSSGTQRSMLGDPLVRWEVDGSGMTIATMMQQSGNGSTTPRSQFLGIQSIVQAYLPLSA